MLKRKIENEIRHYFTSSSNRILIIDGARQVGKSYIIRHVGQQMYKNYIEVNLLEDANGPQFYRSVKTPSDLYMRLSVQFGSKLGNKSDTLVFLDEIQAYPHLFTMLKFLKAEDRFTYIASGSLLGVALAKSVSIPIGSIEVKHMYPLDFEEFLTANGWNAEVMEYLRKHYLEEKSLDEGMHTQLMDLFRKYLLVGGLPDAVNTFVESGNMALVRDIQQSIHDFYGDDASQYDRQNKLKIRSLYAVIPSNMENKRKRLFVNSIEGKSNKRFSDYADELEYLLQAGIALEVKAVSQPRFPMLESCVKNLLKLYLNDVGILTSVLYRNNITAVLDDAASINLGSVYETAVAQELHAHGHKLYYYDSKKHGEVDFLVERFDLLSVMPLEVKSGKDYKVHSAIYTFISNADYNVKKAIVLSNSREVVSEAGVTYMPVYFVMFI